jgi:hypothetical protein
VLVVWTVDAGVSNDDDDEDDGFKEEEKNIAGFAPNVEVCEVDGKEFSNPQICKSVEVILESSQMGYQISSSICNRNHPSIWLLVYCESSIT